MKKDISVCFSKNTDDWKTPSDIYNYFMYLGFIDTFPFQAQYDEFEKKYVSKNLFCNPPYSKLS